jgi:hypothetical protein
LAFKHYTSGASVQVLVVLVLVVLGGGGGGPSSLSRASWTRGSLVRTTVCLTACLLALEVDPGHVRLNEGGNLELGDGRGPSFARRRGLLRHHLRVVLVLHLVVGGCRLLVPVAGLGVLLLLRGGKLRVRMHVRHVALLLLLLELEGLGLVEGLLVGCLRGVRRVWLVVRGQVVSLRVMGRVKPRLVHLRVWHLVVQHGGVLRHRRQLRGGRLRSQRVVSLLLLEPL